MQLTMTEALPIMKGLLSERKLSIFAGSGISVDSKLPAWDGFIDKYIEICEELNDSLDPSLQFTDIIADARTSKNRDLISTITALKDKVKECKDHGINTDFCDDELNALFYAAIPNEYHEHIISTDYKHIITTNYDSLLEKAAKKLGYKALLTRSYSYTEQQNLSIAVYSGNADTVPCGICLQALAEFCDLSEFRVICTSDRQSYRVCTLGELFPHAFALDGKAED